MPLFSHRLCLETQIIGQCRISYLRLVSNLSILGDFEVSDMLSFLRVAYLASQKLQTINETSNFVDCLKIAEREEEVFRSPVWVVECHMKVDAPGQIPQEAVLGPIALIRLLTRLAKSGVLESAQTWTNLPEGCDPKTILAQVKQITNQDVIKKLLSLGVKRVAASREQGVSRSISGAHYYTRFTFVSGAELAHVLLNLMRLLEDALRGAFEAPGESLCSASSRQEKLQ